MSKTGKVIEYTAKTNFNILYLSAQILIFICALLMTVFCQNCDSEISFQPHPLNCSEYIVCMDRRPLVIPCPEGMKFNSLSGVCDDPKVTYFKCFNPCESTEFGLIVDTSDCSKYIACVKYRPHTQRCTPGKLFERNQKYCVDEDDVYTCPYSW